ncbi:uncharacterized protein H6S33_007949 [Morchella sextelata]|uniref:uncharacterized protein n=1 Tax=Morchella sextelata TaxID=1174677 RepID=UPI001D0558DC|nr:uncharacterized protein H6S33_007949 [Morchella sextelata]KAH0602945.1 hypothetical protein H6S33_007949 [Morchella sextelata]
MKFTTFFTTAILLLSAAADAFPQSRSPAATAPKAATKNKAATKSKAASRNKATTKAKSKSTSNRVQSGGIKKKTAATAGGTKKKTAAKKTGAATSCPMRVKGKGGKLGKRTGNACGAPAEKEKFENCVPCKGLKKRGRGQRERAAAERERTEAVLGKATAAPAGLPSIDALIDMNDCWSCPGNRGQVVFRAPQVKAAAERLVSMNDVHETIVPDEGRPWPHDYENHEGEATKNAQMRHPTIAERLPDWSNKNDYIKVTSNNGN